MAPYEETVSVDGRESTQAAKDTNKEESDVGKISGKNGATQRPRVLQEEGVTHKIKDSREAKLKPERYSQFVRTKKSRKTLVKAVLGTCRKKIICQKLMSQGQLKKRL